MDREHDHGPQPSNTYPDHYRPYQATTPRNGFATPETDWYHRNHHEGDNRIPQHSTRYSELPYLPARRYETRQYGQRYTQARSDSGQDDSRRSSVAPRNTFSAPDVNRHHRNDQEGDNHAPQYLERHSQMRHNQVRHYSEMLENRTRDDTPTNTARTPFVPQNILSLPTPVHNTTPDPLLCSIKIPLRSLSIPYHTQFTLLWDIASPPDRTPRSIRETWASLRFSLNLSELKNDLGDIESKFLYLRCGPADSDDRATLHFDLCQVDLLPAPDKDTEAYVYLSLLSPGSPSGTEQDDWRTILQNLNAKVLEKAGNGGLHLRLELANRKDSKAIATFFKKSTGPKKNGIVKGGGAALTGGPSGGAWQMHPQRKRQIIPIVDSNAQILGESPEEKKRPQPSPPKPDQQTPTVDSEGGPPREPWRGKKKPPLPERDITIADGEPETSKGPRCKRRKLQKLKREIFAAADAEVKSSEEPFRKEKKLKPIKIKQEPETSTGGSEIDTPKEPQLKKKKKPEREIPIIDSDTEEEEEPRRKKKRLRAAPPKPEGIISIAHSDTEISEESRRKRKKARELSPEPQRQIPVVDSDTDTPEEPRRKKRKKLKPVEPEPEPEIVGIDASDIKRPKRKKKKQQQPASLEPELERVIPIVDSDAETPEEPRKRKKKKSLPSQPEQVLPEPRGKKSKKTKPGPTPQVSHSQHTRSKGKNKQTPPPSEPRSPTPPRRTSPSNDLDWLQKRLAQINEAKNELFVEEQELKAKLLRQKFVQSKQNGGSDGKLLMHCTCSACGEYGHRKDSWKCEKHPGRKRVLG